MQSGLYSATHVRSFHGAESSFLLNGSHLAWNTWTYTTAGWWRGRPQSDNRFGNHTAIDSRTWSRGLNRLELTLQKHVSWLASSCFYQLRRLRQVRNRVSQAVLKQLVHSFVISRLDYCNSVLAGLPNYQITQLQRVQNAAARLVLGLRPSDHVIPGLKKLHWLPIQQRIKFKICVIMHSVCICQSLSDLHQSACSACQQFV